MAKDLSKVCYYDTILQTIGRTPLVRLNKVTDGASGLILAKVETFNPGGSVKDRIGVSIIEEAEQDGRLKPGGTIVESTSGNTGMGLALVAAVKGYKTVFTLPDKMSMEKIRLLRAFGAEVIVTPTAVPHESPESYTEVAKKVVRETPNSILANQYYNPRNPEAHYKTTGPEIWEQTGGQIDYFVCGVGTGGTITGTGKYLKEKNPNIKVIGIDPKGSALREYYYTKKITPLLKTYKVEGIGQDYVPGTLDFTYIDEMIEADDRESFLMARRLTREEGLMVGGSAGTAVAGMMKVAARFKEHDVVVVLLPDLGERYLSKIFNDDWMREYGFLRPERITARYIIESKGKEVQGLFEIDPLTTVRKTLELMRQKDISQIPVLERGKSVGSVHDSELMAKVMAKPSLVDSPVSTVMEPPFPVVNIDTSIDDVVKLMKAKHNPAVLVEDQGKITGILSRYDVIEFMGK
ncbi:MAG: cystathionine beta-synthase [Bacteroidetes bacterium]|nr:cystathionine beta-synthase [Bacteroidota bacterium]MCW5897232.1 cystathionine beta-synthase [Bacteroidota bacterium]